MEPTLSGLFVTGTDTAVGKTRVTCWLARLLADRGMRVGLCKPAVTGAQWNEQRWIWEDVERLRAACSLSVPDHRIAPFRWKAPLAPPIAARYENEDGSAGLADFPKLPDFLAALDWWAGSCDLLLVEGIGGLLCPLTPTESVADLAAAWGRPLLIVARAGLGTINHTLLTVEAALARGLDVRGIVLNRGGSSASDLSEQTNRDELRARLPVPVWGPIEYQEKDEPPPMLREIDWGAMTQQANVHPVPTPGEFHA